MGDLSNVLGGFNANEVEISSGFEPIPEGEYIAVITSVELKDTRTGGNMLVFDFTVNGSSHDGRILKDRLNIVNSNPKAETIAKESLAKICTAVDINSPKDTGEFIGRKLKIKVGIQPGVGTYVNQYGEEKPSQAQNNVKGYYSLNSASAPAPAQTAPVESQQDEAPKRKWD